MPLFSSLVFVLPLIALTATCGLMLGGLLYADTRRPKPARAAGLAQADRGNEAVSGGDCVCV